MNTAERRDVKAPAPADRAGAGARRRPGFMARYLTPKEPIPRKVAAALAVSSFVIVIGIWSILSYGGFVRPYFLPGPWKVATALYNMFAHEGFAHDVWASF
ncbi:MAG TPA: hypothetical protein VNB88_03520, partial [Gaiellaceae bacterium]|nr:hypothetical protein [Gaiellaceae bacterium]